MSIQSAQSVRDCYNAALDFALDKIDDHYESVGFLRLWREGDWPQLSREWPEFMGPYPIDSGAPS